MKTFLQVISWFAVIIGFFAVFGSEGDFYALVGGSLFFAQGLTSLLYIADVEKKNG